VMVAGEFAKTLAFGQLSATSAGASDGFLLYFRPWPPCAGQASLATWAATA